MAGKNDKLSLLLLQAQKSDLLADDALRALPAVLPRPAASPAELLAAASGGGSTLALVAAGSPDSESTDLLAELAQLPEGPPVAVVASSPSLDDAVQAMRLGAFDYLPGPLGGGDLAALVEQARQFHSLRQSGPQDPARVIGAIVGESGPMLKLKSLIKRVANTDSTVLILGESGTGKELVAKALHALSPRAGGPLVPVNCGAIPHELLESELFGHERGAFTGAVKARQGRFELAAGGAIFLDEIGDMSPMLQVKLLRVLQEKAFERVGGTQTIRADIRIIAATNQNLQTRVKEGAFREDLFYRLNVVPLTIPPLRERKTDIPLLCRHFLSSLSESRHLRHKPIESGAMERLLAHDWPGNVRELENLLERMLILAEGDAIAAADLPARLGGGAAASGWAAPPEEPRMPDEGVDFNALVDAYERKLILAALDKTDWVKNRAAALLKLNRTTLVEKIKKKKIAAPGKGEA